MPHFSHRNSGATRSRVVSLLVCALAAAPLNVAAQSTDSSLTHNRDRERSAGIGPQQVALRENELPVSTLSQLLAGRFPGLEVTSGGATGTGSRIHIRGTSSLLLGNQPLIVVDGIRLFDAPNGASNSVPSRIDDINVSDIASIELVKGPEATITYGTGAANGVIRIVTKRGARGKTRFEFSTQNGTLSDGATYNDLYALWGKRTGTTASVRCRLSLIAAGTCAVDSLSHGNVMSIDSLKPIDIGFRNQYHARLSGGTARIQYSVSGEFERETGVYKMPAFEVQRLETERGVSSLPDYQIRPSSLAHNSVQADVEAHPVSALRVQLSSMYLDGNTYLVANEAQSIGIGVNAYGGPWGLAAKDSRAVPLLGYAQYPAGDIFSQTTSQRIHRFINSASAEFKPVSWFDVYGTFGRDDATQRDKTLDLLNQGPLGATRSGYVQEGFTKLSQQTVDVGATVTYNLRGIFSARTTVGAQWLNGHDTLAVVTGFGLPAGATSSNSAQQSLIASDYGVSQTSSVYAQEAVGILDGLFVTGGVRHDTPREDGAALPAINYPAVGVSWLISAPGMRSTHWVDSLRVRTAYSTTGRIPSPLITSQLVSNSPNNINAFGIPTLPERTAEVESGLDVSLFGGASSFAFSYYNRKTRDGFVFAEAAPSLGNNIGGVINGLGIENSGIELAFNQRLINAESFSASLGINFWTNRNRVTAVPANVPPFPTGDRSTQLNLKGYPLFGLWGRTYTYNDANHDGIITTSEMTYGDSAKFIASSLPTRELSAFPVVEFLNHKLRFSAQVDSKWGFKKLNNTLRYQCVTTIACRAANDPSSSLESQAAVIAAQSSAGILTGFYEDASFVRLREASIVYELPVHWANAIRASAWNVVLTGRNLALHTKYTGIDPEAISSTMDARSDEYFATAPARYYLVRFNFVF